MVDKSGDLGGHKRLEIRRLTNCCVNKSVVNQKYDMWRHLAEAFILVQHWHDMCCDVHACLTLNCGIEEGGPN